MHYNALLHLTSLRNLKLSWVGRIRKFVSMFRFCGVNNISSSSFCASAAFLLFLILFELYCFRSPRYSKWKEISLLLRLYLSLSFGLSWWVDFSMSLNYSIYLNISNQNNFMFYFCWAGCNIFLEPVTFI